jgi:DNA-binding NtrC family response regulator
MSEIVTIKRRILVVDDEETVRESLRLLLSRYYEVETAENSDAVLKKLQGVTEQPGSVSPDLVLLDVLMPGLDGLGLLEEIKQTHPKLPVIMLTASNAVRSAVQAMKIGAVDYLSKPFDVDELLALIEDTLSGGRHVPGTIEAFAARTGVAEINGDFGCMVGRHPLMTELYSKIDQVAKRDTTVLITGESGTGKELVAREIHRRGKRVNGPFVALNCAAIPETLIESELFGHEKGAFTHAVERRLGHFELANGGTLFLDEIGELSLQVQVKILRFLQDQEFYRIGRSKSIRVDVRIVCATNKSLESAIRDSTFRQDLYYRINVVNLEMPPLRERADDIPLLTEFFLSRFSPVYSNRKVSIDADAMNILRVYTWPGNVRELENVTESVLALTSDDVISPKHLPHRIRQSAVPRTRQDDETGGILFEEAERAFETEIILKALKRSNYVQTKAAEILGISRRILKYKMDKLGISDDPPDQQN